MVPADPFWPRPIEWCGLNCCGALLCVRKEVFDSRIGLLSVLFSQAGEFSRSFLIRLWRCRWFSLPHVRSFCKQIFFAVSSKEALILTGLLSSRCFDHYWILISFRSRVTHKPTAHNRSFLKMRATQHSEAEPRSHCRYLVVLWFFTKLSNLWMKLTSFTACLARV